MRIAVTGIGAVTPLGVGVGPLLEAMWSGRQGLGRLQGMPVPRGKFLAGVIDDPRYDHPDRAYLKARDAAREALASSGADWEECGDEVALLVATVWGDSAAAEARFLRLTSDEPLDREDGRAVRLFPNGSIADRLGEVLHLRGPRLVISNACASGNIAFGTALDMMRLGRCRAALVVGTENLAVTGVWGADRAGFTGRRLSPFHRLRDGAVLGEGAGAVVLERAEDAEDRSIAWLEGFGCVCDRGAAAITLLDDGSGLRRAMERALIDAGRDRSEVDYISAHAPGTPRIDPLECRAIASLGLREGVAINATKSLTTHMSAASAVVEVVAAVLQLRDGFVHPNAGLDDPAPELAVPVQGQQAERKRLALALSNACGGGGLNTSLALSSGTAPAATERHREQDPLDLVITGLGEISRLSEAPACEREERGGRLEWFKVERWFPADNSLPYMNRAAQLAVVAASLALEEAAMTGGRSPYGSEDVAVLAGTLLGGGPQASAVLCRGLSRDPDLVRPSMALDHGNHLGAALVCRQHGFDGPTYTLTGSSAAGLGALVLSLDLLRMERARAAVVVGFDALDEGMERYREVFDDCPTAELGEGAAAVVIEPADAVLERRGRPLLRLGASTLFANDAGATRGTGSLVARLAREFGDQPWATVYLAGAGSRRLAAAAGELARHCGRQPAIVCLQPRTGYCMAADALLAVVAVGRLDEPALVLAADPGGAVVAVGLLPKDSAA